MTTTYDLPPGDFRPREFFKRWKQLKVDLTPFVRCEWLHPLPKGEGRGEGKRDKNPAAVELDESPQIPDTH